MRLLTANIPSFAFLLAALYLFTRTGHGGVGIVLVIAAILSARTYTTKD